MTKLHKLMSILEGIMNGKFSGSIQINFYEGGITNIIRQEKIEL